jgi:hypothetical protein
MWNLNSSPLSNYKFPNIALYMARPPSAGDKLERHCPSRRTMHLGCQDGWRAILRFRNGKRLLRGHLYKLFSRRVKIKKKYTSFPPLADGSPSEGQPGRPGRAGLLGSFGPLQEGPIDKKWRPSWAQFSDYLIAAFSFPHFSGKNLFLILESYENIARHSFFLYDFSVNITSLHGYPGKAQSFVLSLKMFFKKGSK